VVDVFASLKFQKYALMFVPVELSVNVNEVVALPKAGELDQATDGGGYAVMRLAFVTVVCPRV
jgi:hypothetical protein